MKLTYATTLVLQALGHGIRHGFDILDAAGLPSGTVYPILRRLEREALVVAHWEEASIAHEEQRPPRRYYEISAHGEAILEDAAARYPIIKHLTARAAGRLKPARARN